MAKHHINKVVLDFSFPRENKDVALQKTKQLFYDNAFPQVSSIFDKIENNIYINKLEIDIGDTTEAAFSEKFSAALSGALLKSLHQTKYNNQNKSTSAFEVQPESDIVDSIIFFLQNGYWQWNIQHKNEEEILKLIQQFLKNDKLVFLLLNKIKSENTIVLKRIISLFTQTNPLQKLFFKALLNVHPYLKEVESFFETIFKNTVAGNENLSAAVMQKLYQSNRLETFTDFKKFMLELITDNLKQENKISAQQQIIIGKISKLLEEQKDNVNTLLTLLEKLFSSEIIFSRKDIEVVESAMSTPFRTGKEEDKISINNAGLVLLHPYLPFLFRELGWIDESKNFINAALQQKAVLFLQFLINGKSKQQEHILVLNKILCGMPVNMPLKTLKHTFTAEDKKAAEEVLDSFIEHWSALKNTSRKGLVESFIKRKGLIQKTDSSFVIQVEKISIDVLLDALPFGIRTVKLPWNEYIIYTEWTY